MGCHSDSGFTHQVKGFYSQLIFGESFEGAPGAPNTWPNPVTSGSAQGSATLDGDPFHGRQSLKVQFQSGVGVVGLANRGLGNEGLFLESNRDYGGYLFLKTSGNSAILADIDLAFFAKSMVTTN